MDGLKFFNSLGGPLNIEINQEPRTHGMMEFAPENALISKIEWEPYTYGEEDVQELTAEQLSVVVFPEPTITLCGEAGIPTTHYAPNGKYFTVRDMIAAVIATEAQTRGQTEWFGGIDLHHVFFEGIYRNGDGGWRIAWGS